MIYLFAGDDAKNKNLNYGKFMESLPEGAGTFFISRNNFDPVQIENFCSGTTLFSVLSAVTLENVMEREEMRDFALEKLGMMGESGNIFVFLEGKLNKATLDAFKKARAEINVFEAPKEKKEKFNTFSVADAFAGKDKLKTWVYFREAVDQGVQMEELAGVLFWKTKDMILRRNFGKFSEQELKGLASRLSYLLPEARKKGRDAESAFEQFLLEAF